MSLRDDTQATDDPQGSPCAWCILLTPLGLIQRESWFRVVPHHSTAFLAMLWAARSSLEEIWDAVASSGLYSQTPLPFWRAMAGCIAIGSLATAVDWFVYTNQSRAVITAWLKKASVEEEFFFFFILTSIFRRSTPSHISGNGGYNSNRVRFSGSPYIYWYSHQLVSLFTRLFLRNSHHLLSHVTFHL